MSDGKILISESLEYVNRVSGREGPPEQACVELLNGRSDDCLIYLGSSYHRCKYRKGLVIIVIYPLFF